MSDENKKPINPNTDDDLSLDFDINLDENKESNKVPKVEPKPIPQENQTTNSGLNFDINSSSENKEQEVPQKETITVQTIQEIQPEQKEVIIPEIKIEMTTSKKEETKTENTTYTPDLNASNETIQQLQEAKDQGKQTIKSNELKEIPTVQTIDAKIIQDEIQTKNEVPSGTINLDEIISVPEIQTQSPIQDTPQIQFPQSVQQSPNPYDIAPQQGQDPTNNEHKKHLIIVIGIVAVCLLAGFFILRTMYPVQFGVTDGGSGEDTQIIEQPLPPQDTPPPADTMFTGENTGEVIDGTTGNTIDHNAATGDADPFQALDDLQTQDEVKKQATIDSLKEFAIKGQYYLDLGKEKGIKDMIKYGVYLTGKGNTFINQIENGEILDISSLDPYLAQFSVSLQKLQDLENASNTPAPEQDNTQETNTGFTQTGSQEENTGTQLDGSTGENTPI